MYKKNKIQKQIEYDVLATSRKKVINNGMSQTQRRLEAGELILSLARLFYEFLTKAKW